jgi:hypothetical protein
VTARDDCAVAVAGALVGVLAGVHGAVPLGRAVAGVATVARPLGPFALQVGIPTI